MTDSERRAHQEACLARVRESAAFLSREFESVQIFVTKKDPSGRGYIHAEHGVGNWFARYGQVKIWTLTEEGYDKIEHSRQDDIKDGDPI